MTQRTNWKFRIDVDELSKCCTEHMAYHQKRIDYWTSERVAAAELMKSDTRVQEQQVTGGARAELTTNAEAQRRYGEAANKIGAHRQKWAEYVTWAAVFKNCVGSLLLDHDDVLFFYAEIEDTP